MQPPDHIIDANVRTALEEDLGAPLPEGLTGDLTARLLPETARARARVITRQDAVMAGAAWFSRCFRTLDPTCRILWQAQDAEDIQAGQTLSPIEMQELVRQLERCASPRTCPHGRPTMIFLSVDTLEKQFRSVQEL